MDVNLKLMRTDSGISTGGYRGIRPLNLVGWDAHIFVPQISLNDSRGHTLGKIQNDRVF
jgi:hypothetical protein